MARKYTRDNRGRFASGGGGATARGGRLRTAAGNKRKTETMKAAGAGGAGVMKGAVKRVVQTKAKPAVQKVAMTKEGLSERLRRRPASVRKFNPSGNPKRNANTMQVESRRAAFTDMVQMNALAKGAKSKATTQQKDQAWSEAFKARPVYSTRQKIKPRFGRAFRSAQGVPNPR